MHNIVGLECRVWTMQLHGHDCHQNVTEYLATGYHTKSMAYTRVQYRNCESSLAKACCTQLQAGPAHAASHVEMAWNVESTLASFFKPTCTAGSPHHCSQKRWSVQWQEPWVRQQWQMASTDCHAVTSITLGTDLEYVYEWPSQYWGGRLISLSCVWCKLHKIRAGSDLQWVVSGWSKQASTEHTHVHACNEVTLVWGSLRLAPIKLVA